MADIKLPEIKIPQYLGTGRRKTAVARVRLASGTGKIVVNGRALDNYFPLESLRGIATHPLAVTGTAGNLTRTSASAAAARPGRLER
jgi:ribosomal protein S9